MPVKFKVQFHRIQHKFAINVCTLSSLNSTSMRHLYILANFCVSESSALIRNKFVFSRKFILLNAYKQNVGANSFNLNFFLCMMSIYSLLRQNLFMLCLMQYCTWQNIRGLDYIRVNEDSWSFACSVLHIYTQIECFWILLYIWND